MKDYKNKIGQKPLTPPVSSQEVGKLFSKEYTELCKKHGLQIGFNPQWKQSSDTGTFSMVIQVVLIEYKEQQ